MRTHQSSSVVFSHKSSLPNYPYNKHISTSTYLTSQELPSFDHSNSPSKVSRVKNIVSQKRKYLEFGKIGKIEEQFKMFKEEYEPIIVEEVFKSSDCDALDQTLVTDLYSQLV